MIDPTVDEQATLNLLDAWAHKVRARIPPGASHVVQLMILGSTIYEPGGFQGEIGGSECFL